MPKRLKYEGKVYQFPDEATEEQIVSFLQENAPQPDKTVTRRAEENLANLKTENPFNRTKSLYAGAPDADRSPGLGDYLDEKLLSAEKAMVGSVPVGIAKAMLSLPAGMASSTGRSIGGETFSHDKSYAFPTRSDQDIALEQPVVRGLGPKKGMAPLLFAGGAYGEAPQTGAPADIARIGAADPFNLSDEAAFYRDWQRPPERIENYDQWLAQQDLATRISPIKNGEINPHAAKNLLGSAVESAPQMATILGASWLGGPGAGAVAGSALGAGNAGADTARYEAERGFSNPEAAMTAALGGIASGATEAIPIGDMLKRGGAAALKPGFWNAVRQAGVNTGKNALEEMPQELTQNYIEAMTAADPSRRMEYDISDPGAFAGRQLEIAAKAGLTSAGFSSVTEAPNLYRGARAKPADIIEGRDGTQGMQPVDMVVPEKGVSAATAPNPDRAARVVPAGTAVPPGMAAVTVEGGLLLYDKSAASPADVRKQTFTPEGLAAFLEANGTPAASGQPLTTNAAQAAPPPLLVPPVAQTDAEVAELAKQIAARPAPPKALEPEEVAKKIERLVADPRTTPEEREILVAKYEQLTKVVQQRGQEAAVAKEMGPQEEPLDAGLPPPEADPYSDDFYLSEALQATDRSAGRTDRLGAPRPYGEQAEAAPFDVALLEDPPTEIPPAAIAERQRLERAAVESNAVPAPAEPQPSPIEQLLSEVPPEVVAQAVEALTPVAAEAPAPKKEGLAERKNRERAEAAKAKPVAKEAPVAQPVQQPKPVAPGPKALGSESNEEYKARVLAAKEAKAAADAAKAKTAVTTPVADQKAAAAFTPVQLKQAEQLVKLAYQSEKTADGPTERTQAEREVEREEKRAREMGIDVDAISRSVGREPTGADGNALPTVAKVVPESAEVTPQVTAETSPFMQARRAAETKAGRSDAARAETNRVRLANVGSALLVVREAEAKLAAASADRKAAAKSALAEAKKTLTVIKNQARAAGVTAGEIEAFIATKTPKPDAPKTAEKKLVAAVAKEKALRAKRDADPENEALLDEYNEATAELYALTKEANGKGVATLDVTTDDDTPSLMKTLPQREARAEAFPETKEPMSREAFAKALEDAKKRLPGIAHLVDALDSQADLPADVAAVANGDRIDGFTQNGRVAVVADGMTSPEHVAATLAHEAVGHLVPESVFGKNEWRKRLSDMMASSQWFRDFVANFGKSEIGSRYKAAELASEAVAFEANRVLDDANYKPPNAYRMFIAKLREWLREAVGARRVIGLSKVLEFSDRDLAAFVARSKRMAEKGLPQNRRKGDGKPSFAKASGEQTEAVEPEFEAPEETDFDAFRRKIQDRMIRLRRLEEAAKKQGRSGNASMYDAEDAAHGKIGSEIEDLRSQFVDPIVRLAAKGNITDQEIGDWLYSVHALDRNARGRKLDPAGQISPDPFSGMTDKEAMDNLTRLAPKSNELSEIAEIVYAMLADERRRYVQSGLATQDEVDSWVKAMGPVYVPLKHEEADGVRGAGVGQGFSALRRTVQSAKGRSNLAENPLFHAIKQAETTVVRANKAEVGREFLKFIRENPNKDLWVEDPKLRKKALADDGSGGTKLEWTPDPLFMRDDIINIKEKGENITVQIKDPLTLRAMKMAFAGETTGEVVRGMAMATRTFGSLLTMLNPEFWGTNPIRDVQTAALNVGTAYGLKHAAKVGKVWGKSMRGVAKFIRDPQSQDEYAKLFAEMRREGATVGWAPFEDAKSIERRIQADMKVLQRGPKDPRTWANTALRYTKNVNEVMENATRLAVYKMATDAGITGRERRALTKNVTVNFNRKGEYGPAFNAFYMFGNVGIQGPVAMASFAKKNPKGFVKVAGAMFALGAANAAANMMLSDDDDDDGLTNYEELQESTKARNWILGRGMIPMAHGWNVFVNAGRYAVETMAGKKKPVEAAVALAGNAADSFSPLGQSPTLGQAISPTFSDPIVQHEGNRTAFDSPIRPENLPFGAKKPDSQLKFKSAPEWAVKTAEGLNSLTGGDRVTPGGIDVSPETLQHGVDWATPGLIKFLWSTLVTLPTNIISGKETRTKDIPIVRRFVNAEPPSADRGRFVKAAEDLDTKFSQAKAYSGAKGEADKNLEKYNSLLSGPLRSRSDFEKMRKLYGQLDDVPSTPEIEDLKLRVVRVAGKQYELAKRTDKYVPLDEGLIDDLTERVDVAAPKAEKADENPSEMVKEALEGR